MDDMRFELAVYRRNGDIQRVPLTEYLDARDSVAAWPTDPEDSTIFFDVGERQLIAPYWNLGPLKDLAVEFTAAADRLDNGQPALVRSAVIEGLEVPFLLFEPQADQVLVSLFIIPDYDVERIFPAGPYAERSDELYTYVSEHREELLHPAIDPEIRALIGDEYFSEIAVPHAFITEALRRAAAQATLFARTTGAQA